MYKQQLLTLAKRVIDSRRIAAEEQRDATLAQLRKDEQFAGLEHALRQAEVDYVMSSGKAKTIAKKQIDGCFSKLEKYLDKRGMTIDDLQPHYCCAKCNDTGYINGETCSCLSNEVRKLIFAESNVTNADYTFDKAKETNAHNRAVFKKAQQVCEQGGMNMLLTGNTGTGKTYLLTACANACAQSNKSVLMLTAYTLNGMFLEAHLSDLYTHHSIIDNLVDVDVLLIDDLGTENVYKNVTAEYMFSVLNERIARKKQTFVSTNLTLTDIRERYDERIFSRLVDQNCTFVAELTGADKRIKKS